MIVGLLVRALPFLPLLLAGGALLTGLGLNWWLEVTDWKTAVVFGGALMACVLVMQIDHPLTRLAIVAILGLAMYLKGGIDKEATLTTEHEAEIAGIHQTYDQLGKAESARQEEVNRQSAADSAKLKDETDAELGRLQKLVESLQTEAVSDKHAKRLSLGVDAVRRINQLRTGKLQPDS